MVNYVGWRVKFNQNRLRDIARGDMATIVIGDPREEMWSVYFDKEPARLRTFYKSRFTSPEPKEGPW